MPPPTSYSAACAKYASRSISSPSDRYVFNALDKFATFGSRLIPEQLASLFTTDAAVIAEAARYRRIAACSQLFFGAEVVLRWCWRVR